MKILIGRILFGLAFAAAGLWLVKISVLAYGLRQRWKRDGIVVQGEIVAFVERADTDTMEQGRPLFAPIVTFQTMEGAPFRFTSSVARRPNPYTVGQTIPVRYMRLTPSEADLDSATGSWMVVVVAAVMAIVFLGVSLLPIFLKPPAAR